ncbi:MAG TPA: ATP-binding protein [Vicinamibacterales bacterium]|nr:ATP-binding protein [Vicinamibacterales bacterium]
MIIRVWRPLNALLGSVQLLRLAITPTDAAVAHAGPDAVSRGWGDETRVRQIIVNLLSNAMKYTQGTGAVTISAGTADSAPDAHLSGLGPWIFVRVEDNGEGIPADRLEAIFEPFEQATAAHADRGTGLGLSISRRLARLMGGELTVQSDVGKGSAFVLWLPVATVEDVPR